MRLIASFTCALLLTAAAGAAETRYAVQAQARKAGEHIMVTCTVTETTPDGKTSVLSKPQVVFARGKQAKILVGDGSASDAYQGEIINCKGREDVLVISTVMRGGDIVWAEAKTIRIDDDAGDQGRRLNGSSGSSSGSRSPGGSGSSGSSGGSSSSSRSGSSGGASSFGPSETMSPSQRQGRPGLPRAQVVIDLKQRAASQEGGWTTGSVRMLTGGLLTVDACVCEIGPWDGTGATLKVREGHIVPVEPADFDAGRIGKLDVPGEREYPIKAGKTFALRCKGGTGSAENEALVRIRSIDVLPFTATAPATPPR